MATDLVRAQIQQRNIAADALGDWLKQTHDTLLVLWQREQSPHAESIVKPIGWRRSITHNTITCLECGRPFRQILGRHLKAHGLSVRTYKERYRIPLNASLSSKATTARRRRAIANRRPWELAQEQARLARAKQPSKRTAKEGKRI
jgi:predicted transcriptional regulator